MRIDPIPFMIARVKETPGLPDRVTVSGDLDFHEPGQRQIDVVLDGGERIVRDRLDRWDFTINHYAPLKQQAMETALLVREYLLEQVPGRVFSGVGVNDVGEELGPSDIGDIDSKEQRIIHRVSVYLYQV